MPGKVKTRLNEFYDSETVLHLYKAMVEDMLRQLRNQTAFDLFLYFTPKEKEQTVLDWLGNSWRLIPQTGGNLGERMAAAINDRLENGFNKVVLIGSDIPEISSQLILDAFAELETNDVVIGPAADGGYYLIGMKHCYKSIFENIDWSTRSVYNETLTRFSSLNLDVAKMKRLSDVDTSEDLDSLNARLRELSWDELFLRFPRLIKELNNLNLGGCDESG